MMGSHKVITVVCLVKFGMGLIRYKHLCGKHFWGKILCCKLLFGKHLCRKHFFSKHLCYKHLCSRHLCSKDLCSKHYCGYHHPHKHHQTDRLDLQICPDQPRITQTHQDPPWVGQNFKNVILIFSPALSFVYGLYGME